MGNYSHNRDGTIYASTIKYLTNNTLRKNKILAHSLHKNMHKIRDRQPKWHNPRKAMNKNNSTSSNRLVSALALVGALLAAPIATANQPGDPENGRPSPPEDLADRVAEYRANQEALVEERREFAESLRDLPADERRAAIEAYQSENADRVAAHRELGELIREEMKAGEINRPERPERSVANRPEMANELQERIDKFQAEREILLQERRQLLEDFRDASQEELAEELAKSRERQKEMIQEQRELARSIREDVADAREDRRNEN